MKEKTRRQSYVGDKQATHAAGDKQAAHAAGDKQAAHVCGSCFVLVRIACSVIT